MLKNKKILHFLLPIVGLLLVNFIYFYPALQGKVLEQDDISSFNKDEKNQADFIIVVPTSMTKTY